MLRHDVRLRRDARRRAMAAALVSVSAGACLLAAAVAPATATATADGARTTTPWAANSADTDGLMFEVFSPDGHITLLHGGPATASAPAVIPMHENGRHDNRIDLIFVGDGCLDSEMPVFAQSAENAWQALMSYEPYKTYQHFFNASRIEIPSPVSGISGDPAKDVVKKTPLGMHFWCHGVERLLCVNTKAAAAYANLVPGISHVVSIAHTAAYGGAGGSITTLAGENPLSDGVIVHEMAHTIAGLGDEYQVPYETSTGSEAGDLANVTSRTADYMKANKHKWWRWLGKPSADGSIVGAYAGANYYTQGFMDYTVWWGIGGTAVPGSRGQTSLNLATAPLKPGWNQVSVYVVDNNPAVIDEDFRAENMTKTRLWWVWGG